jgi:hypothetical protein
MDKITYLRSLHDLIYVANLADTDRREEWQEAKQSATHAQALLDIVGSIVSRSEYDMFLNCFGDFESFQYYYEGGN